MPVAVQSHPFLHAKSPIPSFLTVLPPHRCPGLHHSPCLKWADYFWAHSHPLLPACCLCCGSGPTKKGKCASPHFCYFSPLFDLPQITPETAVKGPGTQWPEEVWGWSNLLTVSWTRRESCGIGTLYPGHGQVWLTTAFLRGRSDTSEKEENLLRYNHSFEKLHVDSSRDQAML